MPETEAQLPSDDIVVLRDVTEGDYRRLLEIRGERWVPRLTYLEGVRLRIVDVRPMTRAVAECRAALRASA